MDRRIRMAHGNGGYFSRELMDEIFMPAFKNPLLEALHDGAQFFVPEGRAAFTTDSYVVTPHFFPGGNIGKLAVCGTVNDLAMNGATPLYLSCGFILEEGLPFKVLEQVVQTMAEAAEEAGVRIVTGDTKVVEKGHVDGLYINTAGIGYIPNNVHISAEQVKPDMEIILTGSLGDHAVAVMGARYGLELSPSIKTDCAPLNIMIGAALKECGNDVAFMRDPTRGGLATALYEIAQQAKVGILIEEEYIPVNEEVQGVCRILGFDPLYLANEGKAILIVHPSATEEVLRILHSFSYGEKAVRIGKVVSQNVGKVGLKTSLGGIRLLEALGDDQVPRIC